MTRIAWLRTGIFGGLLIAATAFGAIDPVEAQTLPAIKIYGDLRLRIEEDWDGHSVSGVLRSKRGRSRIRARLAASVDLGAGFKVQGRLRSGANDSQQNANITFADVDDNPVDKFKVTGDRYAFGWKAESATAEVGKVGFPFFTNNEYFWDADIAPLGGDASVTVPVGASTTLRIVGGGFALPVGLARYSGHLYAGQGILQSDRITAAAGLFRFEADRSDPDRLRLLDDNGSREYTVLAVNLAYRLAAAGKPVVVTIDFYRNLSDYADDPDSVSRAYAKERTGFVLGTIWGDVAKRHHFQLGYRYFRIERLAVNSSYSHDDLARLGNASQALLTDLRGHDIYGNFVVAKHWTVGARLMLTRRITNPEDDKRARVDFNYAF